jgi:glycosyltransferase involved in cell wall biosynthesis
MVDGSNHSGPPRHQQPSTERIFFLTANADGIGGIARTVSTLASSLAERHEVEVLSVYRRRRQPAYPMDPRVTVTYLVDRRPVKARRSKPPEGDHDPQHVTPWSSSLHKQPSDLVPRDKLLTGLTDAALRDKLAALPPGVLISTRPSLHAIAARLSPRHVVTVGQDHMNFHTRFKGADGFEELIDSVRRLDSWAVLTKADAEDYAPRLEGSGTVLAAIPNASPWSLGEPSPLTSKIVIGAGRLVARKGFDRMIAAWAPVATAHPDWQLHIYGTGPLRDSLMQQVADLGLTASVHLKGHTMAFEEVLAQGSLYAMTSHEEGFPMVLVEALSKGLPLVSMDCPRGPAEIVVDTSNGRLVPNGDIPAFSEALLEIVGDDETRRRMGQAAWRDAHQYTVETITKRWEELFERLVAARKG